MNGIQTIESSLTALMAPSPSVSAPNGDFSSMLDSLLVPAASTTTPAPPAEASIETAPLPSTSVPVPVSPELPVPEATVPVPVTPKQPSSTTPQAEPETTLAKLTKPLVPGEIESETPTPTVLSGPVKNPEPPSSKPKVKEAPLSSELPAILIPFVRPASLNPGFESVAQPSSPAPQRVEAERPALAPVVSEQVATIEIQKESVAVAKPMIEVRAPLVEIPTVAVESASMPGKFSQKDSGANHDEQSADATPQDTVQVPVFADTPARFDSNFVAPEPARPVAHVPEPLPQPQVLVAHRVSIDIGDADNRVTVTLHERAGEVSVKFHTASETMKSELQSSVGSLVEALHREHVPLTNMDFTSNSSANPNPDPEQQKERPRRQAPRAPRPNEKFTLEPTDADSPAGIRILA